MAIEQNQIRTIVRLKHGSERYGNCEVCARHVVGEIYVLEKFPLKLKDTGAVFLGEVIFQQYGHKECLEAECGGAVDKSVLKLVDQSYFLPDRLVSEFRSKFVPK